MENPAPKRNLSPEKVRSDAEWLYRSPPLLAPSPIFSFDSFSFQNRLKGEDFDLPIPSKPRFYKLGIYAEALIESLIQKDLTPEFLHGNISVFSSGAEERKNIGEYDLLWRETVSSPVVHLEFALKYFLLAREKDSSHEPPTTPSEWVGPHARDRLQRKIEKLRDRQLKLSEHPDGKMALLETFGKNRDFEVQKKLMTRGIAFLPWGETRFLKQTDFLHSQCVTGWWCRKQEWLQYTAKCHSADSRYLCLPREYWIPGSAPMEGKGLAAYEFLQTLQDCEDDSFENESLMVGEYDPTLRVERSRGFLVYNGWPCPKLA
jgi:uncharacterized protein